MEQLLGIEVEATQARRHASRLRFACLPTPHTLADFDFSAQPGVDAKLIDELASLRFLDNAGNVLFVGPPGTGKTMLAIGLARAALDAGHRSTSPPPRTWPNAAARPPSRDAGPPPCGSTRPQAAGHRRVRLLPSTPRPRRQRRAVRGDQPPLPQVQTILTSHAGVAGWGERLGDPMLAAAILDRLLHRGVVVSIDGPSYRIRAHQQRTEQLRRALGNQEQP